MLLEIERILDDLNLCIRELERRHCLQRTEVARHWVNVVLQYPKEKMPDPEGAKRLLKLKIPPKYERATIENYRPIRTEEDIDKETGKAKLDKHDVWYVHLQVPREFVENIEPSQLADVVQKPQQQVPSTAHLAASAILKHRRRLRSITWV